MLGSTSLSNNIFVVVYIINFSIGEVALEVLSGSYWIAESSGISIVFCKLVYRCRLLISIFNVKNGRFRHSINGKDLPIFSNHIVQVAGGSHAMFAFSDTFNENVDELHLILDVTWQVPTHCLFG